MRVKTLRLYVRVGAVVPLKAFARIFGVITLFFPESGFSHVLKPVDILFITFRKYFDVICECFL